MAVSPDQQRKRASLLAAAPSADAGASKSQEEIFAQADLLLFKEKMYVEAEAFYRQIIANEELKEEKQRNLRNCVDALISIGYCIKFRTTLLDLLEDKPAD